MNTNYPDRIGEALSATFPELGNIPTVAVLKDGFRNIVVETPDGDIFKIARSWEASATFTKEVQYLPVIGASLSAPIPYPVWHAARSTRLPFGVLGYPKLPGTQLTGEVRQSGSMAAIAEGVARFLISLHRTRLEGSIATELPGRDTQRYHLFRTRDSILPVLRELLTGAEYAAVETWWNSFLADREMWNFQPVLQHGDLGHDNILVDGGMTTITGVVDFENLALGDPAQDFAAQLHLGQDFAEAVLEHYQSAGGILDDTMRYRIQKLWELRGFGGMQLAIHFEDQHEFDASLSRLLDGPILNETSRRDTAIWQPLQN